MSECLCVIVCIEIGREKAHKENQHRQRGIHLVAHLNTALPPPGNIAVHDYLRVGFRVAGNRVPLGFQLSIQLLVVVDLQRFHIVASSFHVLCQWIFTVNTWRSSNFLRLYANNLPMRSVFFTHEENERTPRHCAPSVWMQVWGRPGNKKAGSPPAMGTERLHIACCGQGRSLYIHMKAEEFAWTSYLIFPRMKSA